MYSHKRKSSRDPITLQESDSERERIFSEQREIPDFLELRADHAAQGEQAAPSKLSEAECRTRLLLEEQKNHILIEARSEMKRQGLRVESADRALRESSFQIHFQRLELYLICLFAFSRMQNYKPESGCKFVEKCKFRHKEVDSQPNKKPKKNAGKVVLLPIEEFKAIRLCVSGCGATAKIENRRTFSTRKGKSSCSLRFKVRNYKTM